MGKIKDDQLLLSALKRSGHEATLVCWNKINDLPACDAVIVRSTWGCHREPVKYIDRLRLFEAKGVRVFNSPNDIDTFFSKANQTRIMHQKKVSVIPTLCINDKAFACLRAESIETDMYHILSMQSQADCIVIKPSISASGEGAVIAGMTNGRPNTISTKTVEGYIEALIGEYGEVLVQPFITYIDDGEYSFIYINGNYSHTVKRYPPVFNDKRQTVHVLRPPEEAKRLSADAASALGCVNQIYARVDIIMTPSGPLVLEVEINEPDLFFRYLGGGAEKAAGRLVDALEDKIKC